MEKALFLESGKESLKGFDRIYYGAEFCEHLLPAEKDLAAMVDLAYEEGKEFTFVTPFVTDSGIKKLNALLPFLAKKMQCAEVVFNDFGVLSLINENNLMPVMGRLLTKQKNDPRTVMLRGKIGKEAYNYFQRSNFEWEEMQEFLKANKIRMVEVNNLLQGIELPKAKNLKISLHYPDVYVTTTRLCMANSCTRIKDRLKIKVDGCARECLIYKFELEDKTFPVKLFMKGNTQFYENKNTKNLKFADRIVYSV